MFKLENVCVNNSKAEKMLATQRYANYRSGVVSALKECPECFSKDS